VTSCRRCDADAHFLRRTRRPAYESLNPSIRIADLFAGGGGLSLGLAEAARRAGFGTIAALAVESDTDLADVYAVNFPGARVERTDVSELFDGDLGSGRSRCEGRIRRLVGPLDVLAAGPPCQGHSHLNNHTRHRDPRNRLYLRAVQEPPRNVIT
jgi:DNA (cytosine-5)-methyltransferase 1